MSLAEGSGCQGLGFRVWGFRRQNFGFPRKPEHEVAEVKLPVQTTVWDWGWIRPSKTRPFSGRVLLDVQEFPDRTLRVHFKIFPETI